MKQFQLRSWQRVPSAMVLLLAALTTGCEPPGKPNPADRPRLPDQVVSFDQLFATNCVGCHGVNGERGPAPPLNNPLFVAIVPEDDLLNVIRHGRSDTPMPPFAQEWGGTLTDEQIKILAEGIRTKWKSDKSVAESLPPYAAIHNLNLLGATDDVKRGEELFARACATCHGDQGKGIKLAGRIENAINVPAFLALISDQAVRRTIICGRQDLGMPTYADGKGRPNDFKPLTSDEIDALVALIAHWRAAGSNLAQTDQ